MTEQNKKKQSIRIRIKGYKKFMKRIRKMRKESIKLNRALQKSVELKERLF